MVKKVANKKINPLFLVLLLITIIMVFLLLVITNKNNVESENISLLNKNNYDFMNLVKEDYKYVYGDSSQFGIDVSSHNGIINWNDVDVNDLDFVYVRLGYRGYTSGGLHLDSSYESNMEQLEITKLKIGVYWFPQAITEKESIEEAEFVLKNLKNYDIQLPVVIDLEAINDDSVRSKALSIEERTNLTNIFLQKIKDNGYKTMIYSNYYYLRDNFDLESLADNYFWIANYNDDVNYPYDFQIWQYSNEGIIEGISESVDYNLLFKGF